MNKYEWGIVVVWTLSVVIADLEWLAAQASGTALGYLVGASSMSSISVPYAIADARQHRIRL